MLDSQYATIITLIHGNLKPIVGDETFLKAYVMANLYEDPEEAVKILQRKVPYDERTPTRNSRKRTSRKQPMDL